MNAEDAMPARPLQTIRLLLENIKFAHTVFALPFALLAMFLASAGLPHPLLFVLIVICMVSARSAAMTTNRIHDARIDRRNPRTSNRPIPAGRLAPRAAWLFLLLTASVFLAGAGGFWVAFGNPWPTLLAGPALAVICGYPAAKRFTSLSHFWLGLALAIGPAGAWIATSPATFGREAIILSGAVLFWTAGFDIIYACQDTAVDRRDGLFAIPARLGVAAALWISRSCHAVAALLLICLGLISPLLGALYAIGVGLVIVLLAVEQSLVRPGDLSRVNLAFFTLNGLVSLTLAGLAIADIIML